jgi:glutaconyl-CoA/methylmalonyl-CoA decarboxylase subunit delta
MYCNFIILNFLTADNTVAVNTLIWLNIILLSVIVLYFVIRVLHPWTGKYRSIRNKRRAALKKMQEKQDSSVKNDEAAIAMALYLYFNEMHDEESDVITVKRVSKTYSPWSSKLYSMRNLR